MGDAGLWVLAIVLGTIIAFVIVFAAEKKMKMDHIKNTYQNRNTGFNLNIQMIENNTAAYLSWNRPNGVVNGYRIFRESPIGSGFYCIVNNTGPNVTNYVDRGLNPKGVYGYQIAVL